MAKELGASFITQKELDSVSVSMAVVRTAEGTYYVFKEVINQTDPRLLRAHLQAIQACCGFRLRELDRQIRGRRANRRNDDVGTTGGDAALTGG